MDQPDRHSSLIWTLEEVFEIELSVKEEFACVTPAHIERILLNKVEHRGSGPPLFPPARERVRAALAAVLGREVAMDEDLDQAFGRGRRRELWQRFEQELGASLGTPGRPAADVMVALLYAAVAATLLFVLSRGEHFLDWYDRITPTVILGGAAGAAALYFLVSRFRAVQVPFYTGEDAAMALALCQRSGQWSREQIREVIAFCVTRSYEIAEVDADTPLPG